MLYSLVPLILVLLAYLVVPERWFISKTSQWILWAGVAAVVLRYLHWRLTQTVLPADDFNIQSIFVWIVFIVEMLVWSDTAILFLLFPRRTDHSKAADGYETKLRNCSPDDLPSVDVLIATYNEPLDVLERTVLGALAIDWPTNRLKVYVLDDGRRNWLKEFCQKYGAHYLTRADNVHAKAGNINAALKRVKGDFFLTLDADFVPNCNFLFRAVGFFSDPKVGIVQIPHSFYNSDPMQVSFDLRKHLPGDQTLFFSSIMPGRDGWDCAFCCGSNSITRRSALRSIGDELPTKSITEDLLLTMTLLRKKYVTRFLNERLALGLAPESLSAFFVQRARWAQGALQILFLRNGPLGPGLRLHERLIFLPLHWLALPFGQVMGLVIPPIYLWFGLAPLLHTTTEDVLYFQMPAIVAATLAVQRLNAAEFFPLASAVHSILQAFRLLPVVVGTLFRPHGHPFKVTPKGSLATGGAARDTSTIRICMLLIVAMFFGVLVNSTFSLFAGSDAALKPVILFWTSVNTLLLLLVITVAASPPLIAEERKVYLEKPAIVATSVGTVNATLQELSLSGARVSYFKPEVSSGTLLCNDIINLTFEGIDCLPAIIRRTAELEGGWSQISVDFLDVGEGTKRSLILLLFAGGFDSTSGASGEKIAGRMIRRIFEKD